MKMCKPRISLFSLSSSLNSSGPSEPDYTKKRSLENIHFEKEKKKEWKPLEKDEIAKDFMAQQQ